jgi:hypothetical protein
MMCAILLSYTILTSMLSPIKHDKYWTLTYLYYQKSQSFISLHIPSHNTSNTPVSAISIHFQHIHIFKRSSLLTSFRIRAITVAVCFDSTLILWTLTIKFCMASCIWSFNVCLNSSWWFMLCLVYISCLVLVLVSKDRDWLCQLGPSEYTFSSGWRQSPASKMPFLNK